MDWYVIHVYSGYEKKVKRLLTEEIASQGMSDRFGRVFIPVENVSRIRGGKRKTMERQIYPGYILVEMDLTKETTRLVLSIPGVTSFLGSRLRPQPLREDEVKRLEALMGMERPTATPEVPFIRGESVRIVEGPFAEFTGVVEEIYPEREKLRVMVTIFGRSTPVELSFLQAQPI